MRKTHARKLKYFSLQHTYKQPYTRAHCTHINSAEYSCLFDSSEPVAVCEAKEKFYVQAKN